MDKTKNKNLINEKDIEKYLNKGMTNLFIENDKLSKLGVYFITLASISMLIGIKKYLKKE